MTRANAFILCTLLLSLWAILPQLGLAQTLDKSDAAERLAFCPAAAGHARAESYRGACGGSSDAGRQLPRAAGSQTRLL